MPAKKKTPRKRAKKTTTKDRDTSEVTDSELKPDRPEQVEVLISGSYPNPMWAKGVDKNGKLYKIRVPKRFSNKLLHKLITVQAIDGELEEYYKYEP